ncbi:hypothetical protein [Aneurinibacillus terranovensis]
MTGRGPTKHPGISRMETIVGLIDLPATRSTSNKKWREKRANLISF